jgi:hypothetical protein
VRVLFVLEDHGSNPVADRKKEQITLFSSNILHYVRLGNLPVCDLNFILP